MLSYKFLPRAAVPHRRYLSVETTLAGMYRDFKEEQEKIGKKVVTAESYRKVLKEMNISVKRLVASHLIGIGSITLTSS